MKLKLEFFLVIFLGFEGIKTLDWFNVKTLLNDSTATITPTLTPTLTPTPTPTITPTISNTITPTITATISNTITPTISVTSCTIQFPTTTLICPDRKEGCKNCKDNQMCVQVGKVDDGTYKCPQFECQDCPEPVCNPTCGCKEECVISRKCKKNQCPIAKCRALPTCLSCPPISCDSVKCENNFECKIKPGSCDVCPSVTCEPKPCIECPTEPITCLCPRGKQCKIIEGSCYKCQSTICVDIPDPCADCKGECSVTPHPNCENCPPQRVCVERCRKFSPFLPNWKCNDPRNALYISRTCTSCSEYRCLNECKNCSDNVPICECENEQDCILQPRTCNQCSTFYCKKECVKSGPGEECECEDVNLCVYRPGNCFTRSYYECVPPGKGTNESVDLVSGRALAKKRNYK